MDSFRLATLKQIAKSAGILTDKVKEKINTEKSAPIQPTQPGQPGQNFNYSNANINLNYPGVSVVWSGPGVIHQDGSVNFLFFFRGGNNAIMNQSQTNAVVINADAGGAGGGASGALYGSPNFINSSIQSILKQLEEKTKIETLKVGHVGICGWSGGYDPIYRILKQKAQLVHPIDYVGVFDGMHNGGVGKPDEKAMQVWVEEAKEATNGGTQFVITHTSIKPNYLSSTESSQYLINQLGMQRVPYSGEWNGVGKKPETIAQKGNFKVLQLYSDKAQEPNEGKQHTMAKDFSSNVLPSWN